MRTRMVLQVCTGTGALPDRCLYNRNEKETGMLNSTSLNRFIV